MNHVELFFGCPWCFMMYAFHKMKNCWYPTAQNWLNHGSWINSYLQLGSAAHPIRLGFDGLGPSKSSTLFLGEFPHVWFLSGIFFFYLLMFGGLYLHLSVRHISICVLVCVASPLFVLCNYHLAHYNSHFGRGAPRNIRSLVGHKSNMTLLSWWTYPPQLSHDKFPGWLVMIWELPGRGLW